MQSSEAEAELGQGPRVGVAGTEEVPYLAEVRAVLVPSGKVVLAVAVGLWLVCHSLPKAWVRL